MIFAAAFLPPEGELTGQRVELGGVRAGGHRQRRLARRRVPTDEHHETHTQQNDA